MEYVLVPIVYDHKIGTISYDPMFEDIGYWQTLSLIINSDKAPSPIWTLGFL